MNRALGMLLGLAAALLTSCTGAEPTTPTARIEVFTADERVPRNTPVTLLWLAADAGVQDGMLSCELTRRLDDAPPETTLDTSCTGSLIEVPPAPLTATTVHYQLKVLKQPYDAGDPYLTDTRSVTLDPAMYAVRAGGTSAVSDEVTVSTLTDGTAIIAGSFYDTVTFGGTTFTAAGVTRDVFVARVDPDGNWAWATRAGGSGDDRAFGVSALADGSVFVTGVYQRTATFGSSTLTSPGNSDAFVARVDPDGNWLWATGTGGTGTRHGLGVSALADGSAIVTGFFQGSATFGSTTLDSDDFDAFVARVNPNGTWAWATRAGATGFVPPYGVSTLADGSAIIAGQLHGTATFGATTLTGVGHSDAFVASVDPNGSWAWATQASGAGGVYGHAVSTLADGSAIIIGFFEGSATFGTTTLTSTSNFDTFVARVDPDGSWAWATHAGGSNYTAGYGITGLADGGAIITGVLAGAATFGATTLTTGGGRDVFVARVDPVGSWAWATRAGGPNLAKAWGISALGDSGAIVTGVFQETATFGATNLTSAGNEDVFVARIGADGAW